MTLHLPFGRNTFPNLFFPESLTTLERGGGVKKKNTNGSRPTSTYCTDVPKKLGSMVRINGLFHPLINEVFLGIIIH